MENHRYELKFNLNEVEYNELKYFIIKQGFFKSYPNRKINSLYFESLKFDSVMENISGVSQREKYRLRWYDNKAFTPIFEKKIRNGRIGRKVSFKIKNLSEKIIEKTSVIKLSELIFESLKNDHDYYMSDYFNPIIFINYQREYYINRNGIRLTIDKNINFKQIRSNKTISQSKKIKHHSYIMELKFDVEKKDILKQLIQKLNLRWERHSKYLTGLSRLGIVNYI